MIAKDAHGGTFAVMTMRALKWRSTPVCDRLVEKWSVLLSCGPELLRDLLAREGYKFIRGQRYPKSLETRDEKTSGMTKEDGASGACKAKASQ
jgi:hypothetical protein